MVFDVPSLFVLEPDADGLDPTIPKSFPIKRKRCFPTAVDANAAGNAFPVNSLTLFNVFKIRLILTNTFNPLFNVSIVLLDIFNDDDDKLDESEDESDVNTVENRRFNITNKVAYVFIMLTCFCVCVCECSTEQRIVDQE